MQAICLLKKSLMYAFPQLDADLSCDVAVVGAGITTGSLIADELAGHASVGYVRFRTDWRRRTSHHWAETADMDRESAAVQR